MLVAALVACGQQRAEPLPAPTVASEPQVSSDADAGPAHVASRAITAPHGGEIAHVAVTDDGRAAITSDDHDALRFWPRLDGTRAPVVIRGSAAVELAIAGTDDGFLAALRDAAGGLELLRLAPDGDVRGRERVPADPGFVGLAATASVLLAMRSDHVIVALGRAATPLAPVPGEHVLGLTARGERVFAAIAHRERPAEIAAVREIRLGRGLAWGDARVLPAPLALPIALSPSGERLAGVHAWNGAAVVVELAGTPHILLSEGAGGGHIDPVLGFLDEHHVVIGHGVVLDLTADRWDRARPQSRLRIGRASVIAAGMVVGGHGTHLLLADRSSVRFLGYRDLGPGFLRVTGSQVTLAYGNRVLWLDDAFADARAHDLADGKAAGRIAVDDRRVLKGTHVYDADALGKLELELVDVSTGREVPLGVWPQASAIAYDPGTSVFAVWGAMKSVARSRLDVVTGKTTPLRSLRVRDPAVVELLDPARADGAVAVAYAFGDRGVHVETFADTRGDGRVPLAPATSLVVPGKFPIGVDERGTVFALTGAGELRGYRAGKEVTRLTVDATVEAGAVDRRGAQLALFSRVHVMVVDTDGHERWRVPVWLPNAARFTADGKTLLVNTQGGLLALDTATGERLAAGCGWGFGVHATEPPLAVFLTPVVCAEGR